MVQAHVTKHMQFELLCMVTCDKAHGASYHSDKLETRWSREINIPGVWFVHVV
jgi:hypothetical protein